ncbi:unnamed protein product [Allacma fusca]|uniref:Subtilisin n=1 Tax=Allacma fusca TaxID=39272 RepID=A0A8J2NLE7_9HEXA|nr:unnamed protein product [Allacma fusca]
MCPDCFRLNSGLGKICVSAANRAALDIFFIQSANIFKSGSPSKSATTAPQLNRNRPGNFRVNSSSSIGFESTGSLLAFSTSDFTTSSGLPKLISSVSIICSKLSGEVIIFLTASLALSFKHFWSLYKFSSSVNSHSLVDLSKLLIKLVHSSGFPEKNVCSHCWTSLNASSIATTFSYSTCFSKTCISISARFLAASKEFDFRDAIVITELNLRNTCSPSYLTSERVSAIHAPEVWAIGYRGEGAVVATIDTGVRGSHEALRDNYRRENGCSKFDHIEVIAAQAVR